MYRVQIKVIAKEETTPKRAFENAEREVNNIFPAGTVFKIRNSKYGEGDHRCSVSSRGAVESYEEAQAIMLLADTQEDCTIEINLAIEPEIMEETEAGEEDANTG